MIRVVSRCLGLVLLAAVLGSGAALAAPPKLDAIAPADGQASSAAGTFVVTGKWDRWPVQLVAEGHGVGFEPLKEHGQFRLKVDADAERGIRLVRLIDKGGASNPLPFIVPTTAEAAEIEPNDDLPHAQTLEGSPIVISGRLAKPGDVDLFAFPLKAGQTLVASLMAHEVLGAPIDAVLQLLDPAGFVCAQNHDFHGLDPQLVFRAPRNGTYVVRLFAFNAEPSATIALTGGGPTARYRLTLTAGAFIDYAFPLACASRKPAELTLFGWNIPEKQSRVTIQTSLPGSIEYVSRAELAGYATVEVVDYPTVVEHETGSNAEQAVELPIVVSGRIDRPGDTDRYRFSAKKGQRLTLRLESRSLGFPLDGVLKLTDAKGRLLTRVDDVKNQRDPTISYQVPADGGFEAALSDLTETGSPRHVYRLTVDFERPDFALKLAAATLDVPVGKSAELPLAIERSGGLKDPLELRVEGLPRGISAKVLDAPATNSSKARLQFQAAAGAQSGTVTISGQSPGGRTHLATAPAGFGDATATNIWIVVTGGK